MEEMMTLENQVLTSAQERGWEVRIIFTTGYQAVAVIQDFDCNVILARVKVGDRERDWLIYRQGISTIELN